jgi:amidohydrolase
VVPDDVQMSGTLRTFDKEVRALCMQRIPQVVHSVATAMGCSAEVMWGEMRVPATASDATAAALVRANAKQMPAVKEIRTDKRTMGSEDCSWFLEAAPGAYVHIGAAMHPEGKREPHHSPRFEISEASLPLAVALMTKSAIDLLTNDQ